MYYLYYVALDETGKYMFTVFVLSFCSMLLRIRSKEHVNHHHASDAAAAAMHRHASDDAAAAAADIATASSPAPRRQYQPQLLTAGAAYGDFASVGDDGINDGDEEDDFSVGSEGMRDTILMEVDSVVLLVGWWILVM